MKESWAGKNEGEVRAQSTLMSQIINERLCRKRGHKKVPDWIPVIEKGIAMKKWDGFKCRRCGVKL